MKLAKGLLLGAAAGLATVAGANAADLPAKKAAPVEYVRVCSTYGVGFFYIPGTQTCLRVGGRVRAEYLYNEPFTRAAHAVAFRARGRIQADARTETAYGLLRSFVRFEITKDTGSASSANLAQGFIQFGGLTAGRVTSFFDNSDLPTEHMGTLRFSDAPDVNLLAYTFSLGNGFSASLAIEDGTERRNGFQAFAYGGQRAPDFVGHIKYTGTWGTAQLSGALHEIRGRVVNGFVPDTEYGFAVSGQVGVNLPMLGEGDVAWLAVTYADGALGYINGGQNDTLDTGWLSLATADGVVTGAGNVSTGRAWSVAGGLTHYWTPQIRQSLFGSYARFEYSAATGIPDFSEWRIGSNAIWQPVSGLDIGVEVFYVNLDPRGFVVVDNRPVGSDHNWEGRLRIQRDF